MSITTGKLSPNNAAAKQVLAVPFRDANNLTAKILRIRQVPFSFLVEAVRAYASAITDTVTGIVGVVAPGQSIQGVTMVIGTTTTKFKVSVAFDAVMPTKVLLALNAIVHKAVADNIPFSSAFTVNVGAAAVATWGCVRVQMDALGAISTKVVAADQAFTSEAYAKYQCPPADPGFFDCGTITINMAAGTTFTAKTTALVGGNVTAVNYNGAAAGFQDVCSADPVFVAATVVSGAMQALVKNRSIGVGGGLIVVEETTDNTGSVTDGTLEVDYRAWPLDGEVAGVVV